MKRLSVTRQARTDLLELWVNVAEKNRSAADALKKDILSRYQLLTTYPAMGQARPELGKDVRHFTVRDYVIYYRPVSGGVQILRVLHGARDVTGLVQ